MSYGNERDVEVPAVIEFVRRNVSKAERRSLLDVGAHGSHATYAPQVRELVSGQRYAAIDKIYDPLTQTVVDEWTTGDMLTHGIPQRYHAVTCVSVIEHVGVKPWRSETWKEERLLFFFSLLRAARHAVLVTAPFGKGFVTNEYACVSPEELATWMTIASMMGFSGTARYHLGDHPQRGPWREVPYATACERGGVPAGATQFCMMILEMLRP